MLESSFIKTLVQCHDPDGSPGQQGEGYRRERAKCHVEDEVEADYSAGTTPAAHPPPFLLLRRAPFGTAPVLAYGGHGLPLSLLPSPPASTGSLLAAFLQWALPTDTATMVDLIYWRDVKKTGVVFGGVMVILLSLAYLSLISVVSYTSLAILSGTITFRVYKNIMQAVQKNFLEKDTNLPSDKVHEATDVIVKQINSTVTELKRLFLVEDLVDSVKFGCLLWCLTYLGSWFNGLTLVILAVVALFTLPKVYEQNQAQIDQYVGLVRTQVNDVMSKVKAALPIGNKEKSQ
ncbi:Reticulon-1-A [Portunus trituberculatus]|uniref:Reticulon-like protein n=1 Tax=Portunus trituberculatus TaxID=210409 RepID=A0A5B7E1Y5_PORTR|nr:Reticulon-1-A [Portunus trituberculatus]